MNLKRSIYSKEEEDRATSRNIKSIFSVVILFVSMLCGLAYIIEHYGKGVAVWYVFLWVWAISYALQN